MNKGNLKACIFRYKTINIYFSLLKSFACLWLFCEDAFNLSLIFAK